MSLQIDHPEARTCIEEALPFLLKREDVNCILLSTLWGSRHDPSRLEGAYLVVARQDGEVVAVAIRTPLNLLLSDSDDQEAIPPLARDVHEHLPGLDAVLGPIPEIASYITEWKRLTGRETRPVNPQRIYRLEQVRPPVGVPGTVQVAEERDRPLAVDWAERFGEDAGLQPIPPGMAEEIVDRHLALGTLYFWVDRTPVSMAAMTGETPNGMRVNLVYTPPDRRRRGYGAAITAAVSQRILDRGKRWCFLYTDLRNPTTNHIYQAIGYRPVRDAHYYALTD